MKKTLLLFTLFLSAFLFSNAQGIKHLEQYKLDNGLTIILNQDPTRAEVFGYMVCKAGGKDDPSDATGMAHYMEHMLFKGTSQLGTTDWEKEKVHIDAIFKLYDELGKTTDEEARKAIQTKINEQSIEANKYAIPNEFSNVVKKMGGTGLNANTSPDRTVFFNTFPSNQIEPWLELYAHRIQDAVFRGFQSELEVVYEEKNMYSDNFFMNMLEAFQNNFFKVHPYGQQTIIGTSDDLKNPSLTKMHEFYKTWYVPNNMALVLSGDFNSEQIKPLIEKAFGSWEQKETPERKIWKETPPVGRELVEVKMSPVKIGMLGFATVPEGHEDALALEVLGGILSNENGSGLMDQLALNNELLAAQLFSYPYFDYGLSIAFFVPKIVGQSLEDAEKLLLDKINLVKTGEFDDWRVDAVKKEIYRQHQESMETNKYRGVLLGETFAMNHDIFQLRSYPERINKITKEDIIRVANKYYGNDYLAFFSGMGKAKKDKIEKPGFKPVVSNTAATSSFAKKLEQIEPMKFTPKYIDFNSDVKSAKIKEGVTLYCTNNPQNDIFSINNISYEIIGKQIILKRQTNSLRDTLAREVYGAVIEDISGLPLSNVNVYFKESLHGTTTNIEGKFSIENTGKDKTLVFSSVGYKTIEVS
ncbi:MAG: insulinase family protein, partial [Salinivirgaceae bacterium]|nr:insulinase family protein [Salinivirgaceae bacterium]